MKKLIFIAFCFLLTSCSDTITLDMYDCTTNYNAISCDNSCTSFDVTRTFKVNVERQQVLSNGKLQDNCKVFDKENWSCNASDRFRVIKYEMRNGKYYMIWDVTRAGGEAFYGCGK